MRGGRTNYSISELKVRAPVSQDEKQLLRWMDSVAYEVVSNERSAREQEAVSKFILQVNREG